MRTPLEEHRRLCALASQQGLPDLPYRPVVGECCGRGCEPCVWDYYERAMARWRERSQEARQAADAAESDAAA